jgi:hypothetical protein
VTFNLERVENHSEGEKSQRGTIQTLTAETDNDDSKPIA